MEAIYGMYKPLILMVSVLMVSLLVSYSLNNPIIFNSVEIIMDFVNENSTNNSNYTSNIELDISSHVYKGWTMEKGIKIFLSKYVGDLLNDRLRWNEYLCKYCINGSVWTRVKILRPLDPCEYVKLDIDEENVFIATKFTIYEAHVVELLYGNKSLEGKTIYVLSIREAVFPREKRILLSSLPPILPGREYITYLKGLDKNSISYYVIINGSLRERAGIDLDGKLYRLGNILMVFIVIDDTVYNLDTQMHYIMGIDKDYGGISGIMSLNYKGDNMILKSPIPYSEFKNLLLSFIDKCK